MEDKKELNEKNEDNKKKDKQESVKLTYNLSDQLDKLFPQFKPSKNKKEDNK